MSAKENLNIANKYYELFNKNDFNSLIQLWTDNPSFWSIPDNQKYTGKDGIKKSFNKWKKAFPDAKCDVKNMVANDEYIVTEFIGTGKHDGTFETPMGKFDPTHKKLNLPFVEIIKLKNGKIDNSKLYFDTTSVMNQLGISIHHEPAY